MIANYGIAVTESINTLQKYGINQVPIELNIIIRSLRRTIQLCSYTKLSDLSGMTISEICEFFESELGACVYNRDREKYVIYYNDTKNNYRLDRFTIAHELGHIFLKHHHDARTDIMLRKNISNQRYKRYENEANCFARNLLCPVPLVNRITYVSYPNSVNDIMEAFNISYSAAFTRRSFYKIDSNIITDEYYEYFNTYTILYGYYCMACYNAEVDPNDYCCKICGAKDSIFTKTNNRIFYSGIEMDENKRIIKCPRCDNEVFSCNARFCKICGFTLYNICEGKPIFDIYNNTIDYEYHVNDGNARYCSTCGAKTTFYKQGVFDIYTTHTDESYSDSISLHNAVAEDMENYR
jgi:Zn-dependent peptidase ImmA (M78 family)